MLEHTGDCADLGTRLADKAQHDDGFRRELLADPWAAVAKELGRSGSPELKTALVDRGTQGFYLALPIARPSGSQQLSDADMDPDEPFPPPCFDCVGQGCWDAASRLSSDPAV